MQAAFYVGDETIAVSDREVGPPGPGEVQLAVAYTGICGTDLHILHGHMDHRVSPPGVIGHEMSGTVALVGDGVTQWQIGDPVTVMPLRWCGACPACLAGHQHICERLVFVGIDSTGSMQPRWNVPQEIVVGVPPSLSLQAAALVEPTAVAVHDVRRAALSGAEHVVVIGGGPVGLLIAVVARDQGADVLLVEVDAFRRSVAEQAGFATHDPAGADLAERVAAWSDGAGAEVAFEVSGSAAGVDAAVDVLAVRGRLVVVGIHAQRRALDLHRVFWRELEIRGARVYERPDFERAVELLAAGAIPTDLLVSAVEPLADAGRAFTRLADGAGVMKVLIDCRQEG